MSYYDAQRRLGEAFEGYVLERFRAEGLEVGRHTTAALQLSRGDLVVEGQDLEVKFDRLFASTGNLYIETAEKRNADRVGWTPSGVCAASAAVWYGIGDYRDFFLFQRVTLRDVARTARPIEIAMKTSRGFLLDPGRRAAYCVREWHWTDRTCDGREGADSFVRADEIRW
jgi:hypothetical protein